MIVLIPSINVEIAEATVLHAGYTVSCVIFVSTVAISLDQIPFLEPFSSSSLNRIFALELVPVAFLVIPSDR